MCEDSDGCSDWYFNDDKGTGLWASGGNATLTIKHLDATSITVHREDSAGPVKGIVVEYTGTISNFWINGDVTATWPGHGTGPTHMKWRGLLFPPPAITSTSLNLYHDGLSHSQPWSMCQSFGQECNAAKRPVNSLLVISGKIGSIELTTDYSVQITTYVDVLPGGTFVMRRYDTKGTYVGAAGIYTGKRVGNRIDGRFKIIWPGHSKDPMEGIWNATIASTRCSPAMDVQTEKDTGTFANMVEDKASALACYTAAANKGDPEAEDVAGYYDYVGWGGAPDYKKAQIYLRESAAQGNDNAMISLSKFYREDKWGTPNLLLANYYGNRAALRKRLTQENFATYLLFRGDDLAATVAHEESVVDLMDKGMSRVDAEVKVFKQEDADTPKSSLSPEEYCTTGSKAENNMSLSSQQRETAYMNHASCLQSRRRLENSGRDYLHCVQSYKDSNAIEENCRFSP